MFNASRTLVRHQPQGACCSGSLPGISSSLGPTNSGVTIGPADPALQGVLFQGGAKLLENVGHFSENLTVVLAKVGVLG